MTEGGLVYSHGIKLTFLKTFPICRASFIYDELVSWPPANTEEKPSHCYSASYYVKM